MRYRHTFTVNAPLEQVIQFHSRPDGMIDLTPPPLLVRIQRAPAVITPGAEFAFTLWFGPLPVRWLARFESVSLDGFTDRQVRGPFQSWVHRHTFTALDSTTTCVQDEIDARLQRRLLWLPVGLGMWLGMPLLFAFRARRTRLLLEGHR